MTGPVTIDCASPFDEVNIPGTEIISPNHPSAYANRMNCQATIRFTVGQRVAIQFEAFSLEGGSNCPYDYLEIRDGASTSSNLIGSKLCGSTNPGVIRSTGNSMTITFRTDGSVTSTGFKIRTSLG